MAIFSWKVFFWKICFILTLLCLLFSLNLASRSHIFELREVQAEQRSTLLPALKGLSIFQVTPSFLDQRLKKMEQDNPEMNWSAHSARFISIRPLDLHTLKVRVEWKKPIAWIESNSQKPSLKAVDEDGILFELPSKSTGLHLPLLSFDAPSGSDFNWAVQVANFWEKNLSNNGFYLDSIELRPQGILKCTLHYPLSVPSSFLIVFQQIRVSLFLNRSSSMDLIQKVLMYLKDHHIAAQSIWAHLNKKIVVKRDLSF